MNPQYFPDFLLYTYFFESFMNIRINYARVFEYKNVFPYYAKEAGVKMPGTIVKKISGVLFDGDNNPILTDKAIGLLMESGKVFCKPTVIAGGGKGCFCY